MVSPLPITRTKRGGGKSLEVRLCKAQGITVAELNRPAKGDGYPAEYVTHLIGRAYGQSPQDVRDWEENDVDRELLLMAVEAVAQAKRLSEATKK